MCDSAVHFSRAEHCGVLGGCYVELMGCAVG